MENDNVKPAENQNNDFDASKFLNEPVIVDNNKPTDDNQGDKGFSWDDDGDDNGGNNGADNGANNGQNNQNSGGDNNANNGSNDDAAKNINNNALSNQNNITFDYKSIAKEMGLGDDVADETTFKTKVNQIVKENEQLRSLSISNQTNEIVNKLESFKKMPDEDLVKSDLIGLGMQEDEALDALDTMKSNGQLKIEAQKIRLFLDGKIKEEKQKISTATTKDDTKYQEKVAAEQLAFKDKLNKTETMFGFKIAAENEMPKKREEHYNYVTNGTFMKEIFESHDTLLEASWLFKHRKTIMKALENKGRQIGRKEILDNIQLPDAQNVQRLPDPSGNSDDFNPDRFMSNG